MDFHSSSSENINNTDDMWEWEADACCLQNDSQFGLPQCPWDDNRQNDNSQLAMAGNQTPIRHCGDFVFDILDIGDDKFLFSNEILDQSSDEWLDDYLNNSQMSSSKNDQVIHIEQVDFSDFSSGETDTRADVTPEPPKSATLKIFKGRKSYINSPTKLTTSNAYPFTLFKPCEVQGYSTLKDINQRIHAPPPPRSTHKIDCDPSVNYPTSAFSGKPVVLKTKILTEGGKGSITILRTKG